MPLPGVQLEKSPPEVLRPAGRGGVLLVCDHGSNHVPKALDGLGLEPAHLQQHIAVDIGAAAVTRLLSGILDAPAVIASVSRLVVDTNRELDMPGLIPATSDRVPILGNRGLTADHRQARVDAYYTPFHQAVDHLVAAHIEAGVVPLVIGMHSFTPVMDGRARPWQIGYLWNRDPRLAQAMIGLTERETDLTIGDNEPYSGKQLYTTMQRHGADHGLPQTTVEIRQDLLQTGEHHRQWAALMADILQECLARDDIRQIKYY